MAVELVCTIVRQLSALMLCAILLAVIVLHFLVLSKICLACRCLAYASVLPKHACKASSHSQIRIYDDEDGARKEEIAQLRLGGSENVFR